jgi:hypothetical protein
MIMAISCACWHCHQKETRVHRPLHRPNPRTQDAQELRSVIRGAIVEPILAGLSIGAGFYVYSLSPVLLALVVLWALTIYYQIESYKFRRQFLFDRDEAVQAFNRRMAERRMRQ